MKVPHILNMFGNSDFNWILQGLLRLVQNRISIPKWGRVSTFIDKSASMHINCVTSFPCGLGTRLACCVHVATNGIYFHHTSAYFHTSDTMLEGTVHPGHSSSTRSKVLLMKSVGSIFKLVVKLINISIESSAIIGQWYQSPYL